MAIDLILVKTEGTGAPVGGGSTTPDCTAPHMLDNTYWNGTGVGNDNVTWDGQKWIIEGDVPGYQLDAIGTWKNGYRPTNLQVKIYKPSTGGSGFTFDVWSFGVYDTNGGLLGSTDFDGLALDTVHTVNIPLSFTTYDISDISGDQYIYTDGPQIRCMIFS